MVLREFIPLKRESTSLTGAICSDLLDFTDLQARYLENSMHGAVKKHPTASYSGKKTSKSYMASVEDGCVQCKKDNHPLYGSFIALSPNKIMAFIWDGCLLVNYLKLGHFAKQCPSSQKC